MESIRKDRSRGYLCNLKEKIDLKDIYGISKKI